MCEPYVPESAQPNVYGGALSYSVHIKVIMRCFKNFIATVLFSLCFFSPCCWRFLYVVMLSPRLACAPNGHFSYRTNDLEIVAA